MCGSHFTHHNRLKSSFILHNLPVLLPVLLSDGFANSLDCQVETVIALNLHGNLT